MGVPKKHARRQHTPPTWGKPHYGDNIYFHYRYNMDAKKQHGCQEATWMPRSNMDAKKQHGCQEATWMPRRNMEAEEQHGGQWKHQGDKKSTKPQKNNEAT